MNRKYRSFQEAREFVRSQKLKNRREWDRYRKSKRLPMDIPKNPGKIYKTEWKGLDDWLGVTLQKMNFLLFEEARSLVHTLKLKSEDEWFQYCYSGRLPGNIPLNPRKTYKKEWKGMGDWLGTNLIAYRKRKFRPFEEARKFVCELGLESQPDWYRYCTSGKKPADIPVHPDRTYKNKGWDPKKGYGDWLGSGNVSNQANGWSIARIKELLRDLIKTGIIYTWPDVRLYALLNSRGLLNLPGDNRHKQFFENLLEARKTVKGRSAIEEYIESNSKNPPELSKYIEQDFDHRASIKNSVMLNGSEPVEGYDQIRSPKQIMKEAESMNSICVDPENMQFQVTCSVQDLWNSAFKNEVRTLNKVKGKGFIGSKFHDLIIRTFLSEYNAVRQISGNMPKGYKFPYKPSLMQLFVSYKIKTNSCFANLSRTGSGKTISAILASRLIDSKMTIIVCPNDVVDQWKEAIIKAFPDSVVTKGKAAFNVIRDENRHQYLVLNYDKFSQEYSDNLILNLVKQQIDFLVLDEVHFVKRRYEVGESQRHRRIKGLRMNIMNNTNVKVLIMSATPVINDLTEGKSLLEILTGKEYHDVETRPTIPNAVNMYQKFMLLSVREKRRYSTVKTHFLEVEAPKPTGTKIGQLMRSPLLIENLLTEARIPEIIKHIDPKGQTIIYTEYVTGIIPKLETAVKSAGYSHTLFTGEMKDLEPFRKGKVQVLIASHPVSVGVDELQHGCNRLIFNALPYTNALFEQVIGRVDRNGQDKDINIFVILASIDGFPYDKEIKWKVIRDKRTLTDCVVDGTLPEKDSATTFALKRRAEAATRKWLQRLEEGQLSIVNRSNLNVELIPSGTQQLLLFSNLERQRQISISDFSRMNNIFNNSRSDTIHHKIRQNPQFLVEYNNKLDAVRRQWDFEPVDIIASKIKGLRLPAHIITKYVIGDFGCGRTRLADALKENRMYNFDHHNILDDKIIACDIKSVPLKDGQLDIAVFCLSLMEKNWSDYIIEAKRCLTKNGLFFIAETTKSLSGRLYRLREILIEQGFDKYSDEEKGDFTFIEARRL